MTINIDLKKETDSSYPIEISELKKLNFANKVAIVTNETVAKLHLDRLKPLISAPEVAVVIIEDGEEYKTLATVEKILNELFKARLDRKSTLIAFGGGVVGDMTGFVASIYQRGIDFVQIPTTLLSMTDASVGGKTGVNNSFGKNLIGAFYQPKAVYIDSFWLSTLPSREFGAGVAEIVKMAVMFDRGFFEFLEKNDLRDESVLKEAIAKSVKLKADVVSQDEKESGIRQVLNYGHTFGHVVEKLGNFAELLHGEAVSVGMVMANRLAKKLNLISEDEEVRVQNLLTKYDLPVGYHVTDEQSFYDDFFLDKKSNSGKIMFILPDGIGGFVMRDDLEKTTVLDAIAGR